MSLPTYCIGFDLETFLLSCEASMENSVKHYECRPRDLHTHTHALHWNMDKINLNVERTKKTWNYHKGSQIAAYFDLGKTNIIVTYCDQFTLLSTKWLIGPNAYERKHVQLDLNPGQLECPGIPLMVAFLNAQMMLQRFQPVQDPL